MCVFVSVCVCLSTCLGVVVSTIIDQNPVKTNDAEISRERLLGEAGGEGEGIREGTVVE